MRSHTWIRRDASRILSSYDLSVRAPVAFKTKVHDFPSAVLKVRISVYLLGKIWITMKQMKDFRLTVLKVYQICKPAKAAKRTMFSVEFYVYLRCASLTTADSERSLKIWISRTLPNPDVAINPILMNGYLRISVTFWNISKMTKITCYLCQKDTDHKTSRCPNAKCLICQQVGHTKKKCPEIEKREKLLKDLDEISRLFRPRAKENLKRDQNTLEGFEPVRKKSRNLDQEGKIRCLKSILKYNWVFCNI